MERTRAIERWWKRLALCFVAGIFVVSPLVAEEPSTRRNYDLGPLTANDFAGESDPELVSMGTNAFTVCEMRWKFDNRWKELAGGQLSMKVEKLTLECFVVPDKSWNLKPDDQTLLSHEQGHFELWYLNTLRARKAWRKKLAEGGIEVKGATVQECEKLIEKKVTDFCQEFVDAAYQENQEYDRLTGKGRDVAKHSELRRVRKATIQQLEAQLRPEPRKSK